MSEDSKGGWGATKAIRNAQMVEFRIAGKSYRWIAEYFGVDRSRVFQILNPEKTRANDAKKRAMKKQIEADKRKRAKECGE